MSSSLGCCCCCRELLEGSRKKERLLTEGGAGAEEERRSSNMDVSLLREEYRSSTEERRRRSQVLLFRTVSEELSDAIIPVAQGLTLLPQVIPFDPDPRTYDPWHIHLDLHRRSRTTVTIHLPVPRSSLEGSSRCSSASVSEASSSQQESSSRRLKSTPDSFISCIQTSPCFSFSNKQENHLSTDGSRRDPHTERDAAHSISSSNVDSVQMSDANPLRPSKQISREGAPHGSFHCSKGDPANGSFLDSQDSSTPGSRSSSDESSTAVGSITASPSSSTTNMHEGLKDNWSGLQTSRGSRRFSSLANGFTRQLSVGAGGLFTGVQHNHNYYPFPSRKKQRISEAAKRLGMYSSI